MHSPSGIDANWLQHICREAFAEEDGFSEGVLDAAQFHQALGHVLQRLSLPVPLPDRSWTNSTFAAFDRDRDGLLSVQDFSEAAAQAAQSLCPGTAGPSYAAAPSDQPWQAVSALPPTPTKRDAQEHALWNRDYDVRGASGTAWASPQPCLAGRVSSGGAAIGGQSPQPRIVAGGRPPSSGSCLSPVVASPARDVTGLLAEYDFVEGGTLGEGSFGRVMRVGHRRTGESRACKSVELAGQKARELVELEVALLASLDHPSILRLFETFYDGCRCVYIVTELCEGGSLSERIAYHAVEKGPMPERQAAEYVEQILRAASYCHARAVIHRDLKPDNVLFLSRQADSPLKVIDFGLGSTEEQLQQTRRMEQKARKGPLGGAMARMGLLSTHVEREVMQRAGTPHYMAPEVYSGNYGPKADVWSIGVLTYELLTCQHPFYNRGVDSPELVKKKIMEGNVDFHSKLWANASSPARDACREMLTRISDNRCSAEEALDLSWFASIPRLHSGLGISAASILDELRAFAFGGGEVRQTALRLVARELSESQVAELRGLFTRLDLDGDGLISAEDLLNDLRSTPGAPTSAEELRAILSSAGGANSGGRLGYCDFTAALVPRRVPIREDQLRSAFARLGALCSGGGQFGPAESELRAYAADFHAFCRLLGYGPTTVS